MAVRITTASSDARTLTRSAVNVREDFACDGFVVLEEWIAQSEFETIRSDIETWVVASRVPDCSRAYNVLPLRWSEATMRNLSDDICARLISYSFLPGPEDVMRSWSSWEKTLLSRFDGTCRDRPFARAAPVEFEIID